MKFLKLLLLGYYNPAGFISGMERYQGPFLGFKALLFRGLIDAGFVFLPVALLERVPSLPPSISFFSAEHYYANLIWMGPLVFFVQWLIGGGVIHLLLRSFGRESDMDTILNLTGMSALVIGTILLFWDWSWFFIGYTDQYFLGFSHLIIDMGWVALVMYGLNRIFSCPFWLGFIASIISLILAFPFAILFMRSPF